MVQTLCGITLIGGSGKWTWVGILTPSPGTGAPCHLLWLCWRQLCPSWGHGVCTVCTHASSATQGIGSAWWYAGWEADPAASTSAPAASVTAAGAV